MFYLWRIRNGMKVVKNDIEIEKKFHIFLDKVQSKSLTNSEMINIMRPLTKIYCGNDKDANKIQQEQRQFKEKFKWLLTGLAGVVLFVLLSLYVTTRFSTEFEWILKAIGRICLIKLLPYWNWPQLYNRKCLIEWSQSAERFIQSEDLITTDDITFKDNCLLCKSIDNLSIEYNTTFSRLQQLYLYRGLPVIVSDSHDMQNFDVILEKIYVKSPEYLELLPCYIRTNLILKKFIHIEIVMKLIEDFMRINSTHNKWFLQLHNCYYDAVKLSRAYIVKPYFYPKHLPPFYSSWLLLSQNYLSDMYDSIKVNGLIIMQQYVGSIEILLKPKNPCGAQCPQLAILLRSGESLLFSTDLWLLNYKFPNQTATTIIITTIIEIEWF